MKVKKVRKQNSIKKLRHKLTENYDVSERGKQYLYGFLDTIKLVNALIIARLGMKTRVDNG